MLRDGIKTAVRQAAWTEKMTLQYQQVHGETTSRLF
jgi:hypothetical protein